MKRGLLFLSVTTFLLFFHSCGYDDEKVPQETIKCAAILSDGSNCQNYAEKGSIHCWKHNQGK